MKMPTIFADRSVAALTQKLSEAREAVAAARTSYYDAVYVAEDGDPAAVKIKTAAKADLDRAESRVTELQAAIEVSRKNETAAEAEAARADRKRRWDATMKAAKARREAAAKVEKAIAALTEGWAELTVAGAVMSRSSPALLIDTGNLHGYIIKPESLAIAVKLHMKRCGLDWAINSLEPTHTLPTLCERLGTTEDHLQRLRADDGAA